MFSLVDVSRCCHLLSWIFAGLDFYAEVLGIAASQNQ